MKKIIILVSDEEVATAYSEITSALEYENIPYSASILDLSVKEDVHEYLLERVLQDPALKIEIQNPL